MPVRSCSRPPWRRGAAVAAGRRRRAPDRAAELEAADPGLLEAPDLRGAPRPPRGAVEGALAVGIDQAVGQGAEERVRALARVPWPVIRECPPQVERAPPEALEGPELVLHPGPAGRRVELAQRSEE